MGSIKELPLGWDRVPVQRPSVDSIHLRLNKVLWMALADLPDQTELEELIVQIKSRAPAGIIIRGCPPPVSSLLSRYGFVSVYVGQEAILNLTCALFSKKSLRQLVSRGLRHGQVIEVPFSEQNQSRVDALKAQTHYGNRPFLRHLFHNRFEEHMRCFVFQGHTSEWLAAISVSRVNVEKMQTELMLRQVNAPVGVMEALVHGIFENLSAEGYREWTLGEVPFINSEGHPLNLKEKIVMTVGHIFRYAYNYRGLYRFKNKFEPSWRPVYLCGYPRVSYISLMEIFMKSNFFQLAWKSLFNTRP